MKTLKASIGIVLFAVVLSLFAVGNTDADMQVYDADGQYLGILAVADFHVTVYMPSMELFAVLLSDGTIINPSHFYYESDDCTGQPYIYFAAAPELYQYNGKYWQGEKVAPISIDRNSYLCIHAALPKCRQWSGFDTQMVPAIEAPPPPFTLPIAFPLRFEVEKRHGGRR